MGGFDFTNGGNAGWVRVYIKMLLTKQQIVLKLLQQGNKLCRLN